MLGSHCHTVCYKHHNSHNALVLVLFVEPFDMEGHNRHFSGDTICHDLTARLDKITYILIRLCTAIEFRLDFDLIWTLYKRPHSLYLRTLEHVIHVICLSWTNVLCFAEVQNNIDDSFHDPDGRWLLFELWLDPLWYIYLT